MQQTTTRKARIIIILLCIMALISIASICLLFIPSESAKGLTAHIYQDGDLIESIPLSQVKTSYTLTVTSKDGKSNVIEVRQDAIGIVSADCPDRHCVHQGFIKSAALPITCLPHRLVIQLQKEGDTWD